jgi:hypothetical protein
MDVAFKKLLVALSLKAAEESQGSTRDLFLNQALRIQADIDAFVLDEFNDYAAKNPPKKSTICRHPGSSLRFYSDKKPTKARFAVCTICWKDFSKSEITVSKWYGKSQVKRARHPRN